MKNQVQKIRTTLLNYFCEKYNYCDNTVYGKKERNIINKIEFKVLWFILDKTKKHG